MKLFRDWKQLRSFKKDAVAGKEAARSGDIEALREILESESHKIVARRDPEMLQIMLDSYLRDASPEGHLDVVRLLLEVNANPNGYESRAKASSLTLAAFRGKDEVVLELMKHGGDCNLQSEDGFTPLMMAAYKCSVSTVEKLLEHGGNPNQKNNAGMRAIDLAEMEMNFDTTELLKKHTAPVSLFEKLARGE